MINIKEQIQSAINIYKSGNLNKAEEVTNKLIEKNPRVVFLHNLLGLILTGQEKIDKAIECYKKGLEIDPNYAMIYNNLGSIFFSFPSHKNIKKSEELYKKSILLDKKIAEPHNNLGNLYKSLNRFEEAIKYFNKAIEINPKLSFVHHNLATTYITTGKFDEATHHFEAAIKISPNFILAHRGLSRVTKYNKETKHLKELNRLYQEIKPNDLENKMELAFSLGKAYEDIKSFDESFKFYKEGNEICRKKIIFSIEDEKENFKISKLTFNKKLFDKYNKSGFQNTSPIFIVGMPRSGTTLVEQILSSHPKVFGADEIDIMPNLVKKNFKDNDLRLYFEDIDELKVKNLAEIGKDYIKKIKEISRNYDRTTDKLPINFLLIGFIKLILPDSKIINCYRDPKDNCLSIFKNHFTSGRVNFGYDLNEIVQYYNLYADLMKHWNDALPNFIYNLKYEDLISDSTSQIKKLVNFCNLKWSESCLNFHNNNRPIKTASDTQARSKIYNTSINYWKNYEKNLVKYFINLKI